MDNVNYLTCKNSNLIYIYDILSKKRLPNFLSLDSLINSLIH